MNQCAATMKVILFFREHPAGETALADDKQLARAVKVLEKRAEVLRLRLERRRTAVLCICEQHKAANIVCWQCWSAVPDEVREQFRDGEGDQRRAALRVIFDVAKRRKEALAER